MNVVLIGKTNVGKSTLFNRIIEEKKATIAIEAHTTRDRISQQCRWRGKRFTLIDVGGIDSEINKNLPEKISQEIKKQINFALLSADLIIFILSADQLLTAEDRNISQQIKKLKKNIILAINKVDNPVIKEKISEQNFLGLGIGQPIFISAANGSGVGDLLDSIIKKIKTTRAKKINPQGLIKTAITGKTNVGKSTLINSLLQEERIIVTPIPHTTREPIDIYFSFNKQDFLLIDTAGIRKTSKLKSEIEKIGMKKSFASIKKADVLILLLDINERVSQLDRKIMEIAQQEKKIIVLVINKIDLIKGGLDKSLRYYQGEFYSLGPVPIIFISAKNRINLDKIFQTIINLHEKIKIKIPQKELNKILEDAIKKYKFSQRYWQWAKLYQEKNNIPTIILKIPRLSNKDIPPTVAQINLLANRIKDKYFLWGVPFNLEIDAKSSS